MKPHPTNSSLPAPALLTSLRSSPAKLVFTVAFEISFENRRPQIQIKVQPQPTLSARDCLLAPPSAPRYQLRKGLGLWHLTFDGQSAVLKHQRGLFFVAYLLAHPPAHPLHALDLLAKIPEFYHRQLGLAQLTDPSTGQAVPLLSDARLQERSLALDDPQALRLLLRKEAELEALLDSDDQPEPIKAEALRELEALAQFQRQHARRSEDGAQKAARTVRQALRRLYLSLLQAAGPAGQPHPVLGPFAVHLRDHLLLPSLRYSPSGGGHTTNPLAGCFTYEPPPGVVWAESD